MGSCFVSLNVINSLTAENELTVPKILNADSHPLAHLFAIIMQKKRGNVLSVIEDRLNEHVTEVAPHLVGYALLLVMAIMWPLIGTGSDNNLANLAYI